MSDTLENGNLSLSGPCNLKYGILSLIAYLLVSF